MWKSVVKSLGLMEFDLKVLFLVRIEIVLWLCRFF